MATSRALLRGSKSLREAQALAGVSAHYPVVFECAVARGWAESGAWSLEGLSAAASPQQLMVKRSRDPRFMYSEGGRGDLLADDAARTAATELVPMTVEELFTACRAQRRGAADGALPGSSSTTTTSGGGFFHYFTARVDEAFPALEPRADWPALVVERPTPPTPALTEAPPPTEEALGYLSVWLGGAGTTTQAHYDVANNCFVQV